MASYAISSLGQAPPSPAAVQAFEPLIEGAWEVDTTFANGTRFHQQKVFDWGLEGHVVHTQTKGTVDPETEAFGLRNQGVIAYRAADSTLLSIEVDVFGGVTQSVVTAEGRNLYFDYDYMGGKFRDAWIYVSDQEYRYEIRAWADGGYHTLYLQAPMIRRDAAIFESTYR